jgi:hypothetical protein
MKTTSKGNDRGKREEERKIDREDRKRGQKEREKVHFSIVQTTDKNCGQSSAMRKRSAASGANNGLRDSEL